uniref:RNA-dependent RNA polymerase n=1 Tax=Jeffords solemo-like virus TaxID=2716738 RepID=A0A6G7PS26_9VIRU|nr:RNA-dependent RNA polymerase [Jeffords solemo-like virus]
MCSPDACVGGWGQPCHRCTETVQPKVTETVFFADTGNSDKYGWPSIDSCSVKRSFAVHVGIYQRSKREGREPSSEQRETVCSRIRRIQQNIWKIPAEYAEEGVNEWFNRTFTRSLLEIDLASIPGNCPLTRLGSTMREVLGFDGVSFDPERVYVLRHYVLKRFIDLLDGEKSADPIKVFIKQEPHKRQKLDEGRLRLISAVSIVDTMVDRMLFCDIFDAVKKTPLRTPVAIGWTPLATGSAYLKAHFKGHTFDTDKKYWDWTFPWWLLADCYTTLIDRPEFPVWKRRVAYQRFYMLYRYAVFSFPDGSMVAQKGDGIQKSGCFLTLLLNSLGQWHLHALAELNIGVKVPMVTFGDDVTQLSTPHNNDFVKYYESLGFVVKSSLNEDIEFCGFHIYSAARFLPAYKDKHIFMLRHLTLDPEIATQTLQSYQYIYWYDKPFLALIRSIAKMRGLIDAIVNDEDIMRVVLGQ